MYFMTRLTLPSFVCVYVYCYAFAAIVMTKILCCTLMCIKMSFEVSVAKVFDLIFIARENYRS
jgi:hypothetical protein